MEGVTSPTGDSERGAANGPHPALHLRSVSKTFAGTPALSAFDLTILPGEIHALVGENGSGKSTIIKILAGYHRPDPGGEVLVSGERLVWGSAESSAALGCRFVHQDLGLVDSSSILDNLFFGGGFTCRFGMVMDRATTAAARDLLAQVGLDVDPRRLVATLSPAQRTAVAVARALKDTTRSGAVKLMVFDEPTATLPDNEVHQLLATIRAVAARGTGVLYVTHRLDEIFTLATNVTVLRDGKKVATVPVASIDRPKLVRLLVGSEFDDAHAESVAAHTEHGQPILEVEGLTAPRIDGISFTARPGDIIGIAGITGSGRETLLGTIFGAHARTGGHVTMNGVAVRSARPAQAMRSGMAYLPPDRKISGGVMTLTARENISLSGVRMFWRAPWLRRRMERNEVWSWFERLEIRPHRVDADLASFSGGNQQKILFAKWLRLGPKLFLLDEPTQGVDVGAKAQLHHQLLEAAANETTVILSSSDVDELVAICHRVLVLRNGRIVADLSKGDITAARISSESLGVGAPTRDREVAVS